MANQHQRQRQCKHKAHHNYYYSPTKLNLRSDKDIDAPSDSLGGILLFVFPLLLIYISNQWSRYSISYLVDFSATAEAAAFEAMNIDLQFDQSQYGLLASTAFTTLFALSSLVAGNLADKYDRKLLTLGSASIWTLATLAQSQAHSYNEILIARVIMGGACAFAIPAAYTLIADQVSKEKLAFSNSIYGSGVYLGGALASLSLLLDTSIGWRGTLGVIGGFGAISAGVAGLLLPSDSDRSIKSNVQEQNNEEENNLFTDTAQILSIPRVQLILFASFLRFCSGLLIGVWAAPYYKQAFPDNAAEYAVLNALIVGGVGLTSALLGGYIADALGTYKMKESNEPDTTQAYFDEQTIKLLLPIVGSLLAIPAWYQTIHTTDSFQISMLWLAMEYLTAEVWFGPTIAVLQSTVGSSRTGTTQGLFVLTGAFGNLAPTLLGFIYSEQIKESGASSQILGNLLTWGVCLGYLFSSIFFALSAKASGEELQDDGFKSR